MKKIVLLNYLVYFLLFSKTIEIILGSIAVGFYIDEPYHHQQAEDLLNNGTYITSQSTDHAYTYGPVFAIAAHAINVIFGSSNWSEFGYDPNTYTINHLAVGLLGIFTGILVGLIVYLLTKNKLISSLSVLILLSFPFWTGQSFYNVKDIPVAAGLTSFLAGSILFVLKRELKADKRIGVYGSLLILFGVLLSAGNRPLFLAYITLVAITTFAYLLRNEQAWKPYGISVVSSLLILLIFLPHFYTDPVNSIKKTFFTSSDFPWQGSILMNGSLVEPKASFSYFFSWFFAQTPIILLFLCLGGIIFSLGFLKNISSFKMSNVNFIYILISLQIFAIPFLTILLQSTVYQSLRHFLFIFPALAIFLGLTLNRVLANINSKFENFIIVTFIFMLIIPNLVSARLFPYNANYYNILIAASSKIPTDWETESMGISGREAIKHTPKENTLVFWETVWDEDPYISERAMSVKKEPKVQIGDYWAVSSLASYIGGDSRERALSSGAIFESLRATCTLHHVVERKLFNQVIPMAYVSRCQRSGTYQNGVASISWSSESEVDENNTKFSWVTSLGEIIRISTLRDFKTIGVMKFEVSANPCQFPTQVEITQGKKFKKVINVPSDSDSLSFSVPIELKPYSAQEVRIRHSDKAYCSVSGDDREFVAKISNIRWVEN
jgi:hypothetical protein